MFPTPTGSLATLRDPNLQRFVVESLLCSTLGSFRGATGSPRPWVELSQAGRAEPSLAMDHTRRTGHPEMRTTARQREKPDTLLQCVLDANGKKRAASEGVLARRPLPASSNHW